jgi:glycosyltransferase involved in cell wall biosynthesis
MDNIKVILYYKDSLSNRQNKPFVDYFENHGISYQEVIRKNEIIIEGNKMNYIFTGTTEFFGLYIKFLFTKKVKVLYRSRGIAPEESYYRNKSRLRFFILSVLESIIINISKFVIVVSENHKQHYIKKYKVNSKKIFVIHNYTSGKNYKQITNVNVKKEIVYVGGISKWQNIDTVHQVFKSLSKFDDVSFLICTSKNNLKMMNEIFADIRHTEVTAYENYDSLILRISQATSAIILRNDDIVNICSSPFKIIDYITAGLPIFMTTNIGDFSSVFDGERFIYSLDLEQVKTNFNSQKAYMFLNDVFMNNELRSRIIDFAKENLDFDKELENLLKNLRNGEKYD